MIKQLEHSVYEERLREMLILEKKMLSRILCICRDYMDLPEDRDRLFSVGGH